MMQRRSEIKAATVLVLFLVGSAGPSRGDEADAKAVATIDKAVKALGGEEKLATIRAATWNSEGKFIRGGDDNPFKVRVTFQGADRLRMEFEGEFNGDSVKGVTVVDGDRGWRNINANARELDADAIAREKRMLYLMTAPMLPGRLKGKDYRTTADGEEQVAGKPAAALKVVGPDGKDFRLFFDAESGLPVKLTAQVVGWNGEEFEQEVAFTDYRDFGGFKRPGKIVTRRGDTTSEQSVVDFKVEPDLPASTFDEPK